MLEMKPQHGRSSKGDFGFSEVAGCGTAPKEAELRSLPSATPRQVLGAAWRLGRQPIIFYNANLRGLPPAIAIMA